MKQTRAVTAPISSGLRRDRVPSSRGTELLTNTTTRRIRTYKARLAPALPGTKRSARDQGASRSGRRKSTVSARPSVRAKAAPVTSPSLETELSSEEEVAVGTAMANPTRVLLPPVLAAVAAAAGKSPVAVLATATGAAKEIHASGDWRQGTRAGSHEKSSDYAQRILTEMPLHDALRVYDHDCFDYLDRATDVKQKRARGDLGLFAAIARVKRENGEPWLKARLEQNVASFCACKPDRAAALEGLDKRLQRSLVAGAKVTAHMGRTPTSGVKRKASRATSPLPPQPKANSAIAELQLVDASPSSPSPATSAGQRATSAGHNTVPAGATSAGASSAGRHATSAGRRATSSRQHTTSAGRRGAASAPTAATTTAAVGGSFRAAERSRKKKRPSTTAPEPSLDPQPPPLARKAGRPKKVQKVVTRLNTRQPNSAPGPSLSAGTTKDTPKGAVVAQEAPQATADTADVAEQATASDEAAKAGLLSAEKDEQIEALRNRVRLLEEAAAASEKRAVAAGSALERVRRALDDAP